MEPATAFNILAFILVAASMAGTWMVFVKAGYKGWKAIIPVYNYYILLRITRHSAWWLVAFVAPTLLIFLAGSTVQYQLIELTEDGIQALVEAISLLVLIATPIVITVNAVVMYDIARAFGKRLPFTVGLTLFPFIFLVWLGFGDETFSGVPEDQHGDSDMDAANSEERAESEDTGETELSDHDDEVSSHEYEGHTEDTGSDDGESADAGEHGDEEHQTHEHGADEGDEDRG